jgi:hypothetical protein
MPIERTENQIRARVKMPDDFQPGSFRSKVLDPDKGISAVMGKLKGDDSMVIQSYRFDIAADWNVNKVKDWLNEKNIKVMSGDSDALTFADLKGVEIFATGKWNGKVFKDGDLQAIVDSFKELGGRLKPYLKLGHDDNQKLLQKDGLPAAGWITNLKKVGSKLMADIKDVPKVVAELIKKGAYKRISSEIYMNYLARPEETGANEKRYPMALKAVALLGGDTPAVTNLADVIALYQESDVDYETFDYTKEKEANEMSEDKDTKEFAEDVEQEIEEKAVEKEEKDNKEDKVEATKAEPEVVEHAKKEEPKVETTEDKVNKLLAKFEKSDNLKKDIMELMAEKDQIEAERNEYKEFKRKQKEQEVSKFVDDMIASNKVIPAQKEALEKIMFAASEHSEMLTFSDANAYGFKEEQSLESAFKAFVEAYPDMGLLKRFTSTEKTFKNAQDEAEALVQKYMKENEVSYGEAQKEVFRVRPELFESEDGDAKKDLK